MGFTHPPTNIEPENRPIVLERSLPTPNSWQGPCWLEHDATVARLETDTTIHCARGENFWNDSRTSPVARWCILQWILQIFTVHIYIYYILCKDIYSVYKKYIYVLYKVLAYYYHHFTRYIGILFAETVSTGSTYQDPQPKSEELWLSHRPAMAWLEFSHFLGEKCRRFVSLNGALRF